MDLPGFEPGAFRMQSERDTTTLQTLDKGYTLRALLEEDESAIRLWWLLAGDFDLEIIIYSLI